MKVFIASKEVRKGGRKKKKGIGGRGEEGEILPAPPKVIGEGNWFESCFFERERLLKNLKIGNRVIVNNHNQIIR